jgi:hypothetical protein
MTPVKEFAAALRKVSKGLLRVWRSKICDLRKLGEYRAKPIEELLSRPRGLVSAQHTR